MWYFKIVSNFTCLMAREITYNNFEISLIIFMPKYITSYHAITYTKNVIKVYSCNMKLHYLYNPVHWKLLLKGSSAEKMAFIAFISFRHSRSWIGLDGPPVLLSQIMSLMGKSYYFKFLIFDSSARPCLNFNIVF